MNQHEETLSKVREIVQSNDETNVRLAYITFVQSGIISFYELYICLADKFGSIHIDGYFHCWASGYYNNKDLYILVGGGPRNMILICSNMSSKSVNNFICELFGISFVDFKNNNSDLMNKLNSFIYTLLFFELLQNNINEIEKEFCKCLNLEYEPRI